MFKKSQINLVGLAVIILLFTPFLNKAALSKEFSQDIALVTGVSEALVITDYDIYLRTDIENNKLFLNVVCSLQNRGAEPVEQVDFDLFAREKFYGVKVKIENIKKLANGEMIPLQFTHAAELKPDDLSQEGSMKFPKITRVRLSSVLGNKEKVKLQFEYNFTHTDPKKKDLPYRLMGELPNGSKEICLISDFSWIPQVTWDYKKMSQLFERNFFPKLPKPTWTISIEHPSNYKSMVVDGRLLKEETEGEKKISKWEWCTGGLPQLLIGDSVMVEVKGQETSVLFLLPKKGYEQAVVEAMGKFLIKAFKFYTDIFGPLNGKNIHIAVSSAGMGGHGAFLGTFLDVHVFKMKKDVAELSESKFFNDTAAHELAHSWWGLSVSSYGRGTKFLREAFCNFATWHLAREHFCLDKFTENLAVLFFKGIAKYPLFSPDGDNQSLAYTKGALVLDMLRMEMGDEIFYKMLKEFAIRFKDSYMTFVDFVSVCNEISQKDWMPFFSQWCYQEGYPAYHLVEFESKENKNGWQTDVTIRNDGKGVVCCPLELQMGDKAQREVFLVTERKEKKFTYHTPARVDNVAIDPDHTTYQGDDEEARLKMLAVKESQWEWLNYWAGTVHSEVGNHEKAIHLISRAIAAHEGNMGKGKAHPAFYFSRGIVYCTLDKKQKADEDIRAFFDETLELALKRPDHYIRTLAYAGIISGNLEERRNQLQQILKAITGEDISFDPKLNEWRKWWKTHGKSFRVSPSASALSPSGIK